MTKPTKKIDYHALVIVFVFVVAVPMAVVALLWSLNKLHG